MKWVITNLSLFLISEKIHIIIFLLGSSFGLFLGLSGGSLLLLFAAGGSSSTTPGGLGGFGELGDEVEPGEDVGVGISGQLVGLELLVGLSVDGGGQLPK